jgi:hypothetical protein
MSIYLHFYKFTEYSDNLLENSDWSSIYNSVRVLFEKDNQFPQGIDKTISKYFEPIRPERVLINFEFISEKIKDFDGKIKYVFDKKISPFFMVDKLVWFEIEKIIADDKKLESEKEQAISVKFEIEKEFIQDYFNLKKYFDKNALFADIS